MLCANETVTLVRHTPEKSHDQYDCHILEGVSWSVRQGSTNGPDGQTPQLSYTVRIPEKVLGGVMPLTGDYLIRGRLSYCAGPQDLYTREHFRVNLVSDHRRGSNLRHVAVYSHGR